MFGFSSGKDVEIFVGQVDLRVTLVEGLEETSFNRMELSDDPSGTHESMFL